MKNGQNTIERNSRQSNVYVQDQRDTNTLFRQVQQAQQGGEPFYYSEVSTLKRKLSCNLQMLYKLGFLDCSNI